MKFFLKSFAVAFAATLILLLGIHVVGAAYNDFPFGRSFSGIIQGGGTSNVGVFFVVVLLFSLLASLPAAFSQPLNKDEDDVA